VALTNEGNELLPAVQRSVEELETAMSRARARVKNASQTLSIGAGRGLCRVTAFFWYPYRLGQCLGRLASQVTHA